MPLVRRMTKTESEPAKSMREREYETYVSPADVTAEDDVIPYESMRQRQRDEVKAMDDAAGGWPRPGSPPPAGAAAPVSEGLSPDFASLNAKAAAKFVREAPDDYDFASLLEIEKGRDKPRSTVTEALEARGVK